MHVEAWRSKELKSEEVADVCKLLYSLPRSVWPLARNLPPLALVKIVSPTLSGVIYGMIIDYGETPGRTPYVISAVLDKDGNLCTDAISGELQVAVTTVSALQLVASCGPITSQWMLRHFCDA